MRGSSNDAFKILLKNIAAGCPTLEPPLWASAGGNLAGAFVVEPAVVGGEFAGACVGFEISVCVSGWAWLFICSLSLCEGKSNNLAYIMP